MKRIIYIALLLFWPVIANSQIRIIDTGKKTENATEQQNEQNGNKIKKNRTNDHTTKDKLSDTVYCLNTKKQHGWFSPIETIEKEKARKKGNYFMFTKRNAQGHWTRMETFNGNDEPTWLGGNPYIMNTEDPLGDKEWINKVKTGCITEMIADPSRIPPKP